MKRLALLLAAVGALSGALAGCVAYVPGPAPHPHYRGDRDGDGVPNRWDRRPANPYRY